MYHFLDISKVCQSTGSIAKCVQNQISDCIAEQVYKPINLLQLNLCFSFFIQLGKGVFDEIIDLASNCCPDRNNDKCSIRGISRIYLLIN